MTSLYIIILNFNGYADTMPCVRSVLELYEYDANCHIVVVDNASTDQSVRMIREEFGDRIILLQSDKNVGFAAGNNIGIRYAIEHGAEYICLLNNDTELTCDAVRPCIEHLHKNPQLSFVGPAVVDYYSHKVQSTGGHIHLLKGWTPKINNGREFERIEKPVIRCDMIFGVCIVFRKELIQQIGYMSEKYFLFFEESDWCYRSLKKGYRCECLTDIFVLHKGSSSVSKISQLQEYLMERNRIVFVKRNADPLQFAGFFLYDQVRTVYYAVRFRKPLLKYFKYHIDGLLERRDARFPFVYFGDE